MQLLWKTVWWFLKELKMELSYDPAIPVVCIPKRTESRDLKRYLSTHVQSRVIHNSQKIEANQGSISG